MAKKWWTVREGVMVEKGNSFPHNKLGGVSQNELLGNETPLYQMISGFSGKVVDIYDICPNKIAPGITVDPIKKKYPEKTIDVSIASRKVGKRHTSGAYYNYGAK